MGSNLDRSDVATRIKLFSCSLFYILSSFEPCKMKLDLVHSLKHLKEKSTKFKNYKKRIFFDHLSDKIPRRIFSSVIPPAEQFPNQFLLLPAIQILILAWLTISEIFAQLYKFVSAGPGLRQQLNKFYSSKNQNLGLLSCIFFMADILTSVLCRH